MNEFRIRATGTVMDEPAFRRRCEDRTGAILPAVLDLATLDREGADPVLPAPQPTPSQFQSVVRANPAAVLDALGNWVQAWALRDWSQAEKDDYFNSTKASKLKTANDECDRRMSLLVVGYPEREQQTFPKQESEARAFTADANAATPMIDALAMNREIDKTVLVTRIITKADLFAQYSGAVIGYRQKLEDQITAADQAALDLINPSTGWPT